MSTVNGVTANLKLNHYLTEPAQKTISRLKNKALAFNVLEKISWVAFAAIIATAFTLHYASLALSGPAGFLMIGLILASPFCAAAAPILRNKWKDYKNQAEIERRVEEHRKQISGWTVSDVEFFLRQHKISIDKIPAATTELLEKINPQDPLLALIPLIARFNYLKEIAESMEKESDELLRNPANREDYVIRNLHLERGYDELHERGSLVKVLQAAGILWIIQNPTRECNFDSFGECRAKTYAQRQFDNDLTYRSGGDIRNEYFVFQNKEQITYADMKATLQWIEGLADSTHPRKVIAHPENIFLKLSENIQQV